MWRIFLLEAAPWSEETTTSVSRSDASMTREEDGRSRTRRPNTAPTRGRSGPLLLELVKVDVVELVNDREIANDETGWRAGDRGEHQVGLAVHAESLGASSDATGTWSRTSRWSLRARTARNAFVSRKDSEPGPPMAAPRRAAGISGLRKEKLAVDKMGKGGRASAQADGTAPLPRPGGQSRLSALPDGKTVSKRRKSQLGSPEHDRLRCARQAEDAGLFPEPVAIVGKIDVIRSPDRVIPEHDIHERIPDPTLAKLFPDRVDGFRGVRGIRSRTAPAFSDPACSSPRFGSPPALPRRTG